MSDFIADLERTTAAEWARIKQGKFFTAQARECIRSVYIETMKQIYHYTKNNAINQAAAAFASDHEKIGLLHFAFKHASEELGHERMILRDLASIGVGEDEVRQHLPLPPTEALNGYLYSVAIREGVLPRLGYSFWAEDAYEHIAAIIAAAKRDLGLMDEQMTFFIAHASIDEKHSQEVRAMIEKWVVTDEQKAAVKRVARTTLYLTGALLEAAYEAGVSASA
jgi:pyrroloquinoline quinone (PQQ) biosynthesis protein C